MRRYLLNRYKKYLFFKDRAGFIDFPAFVVRWGPFYLIIPFIIFAL